MGWNRNSCCCVLCNLAEKEDIVDVMNGCQVIMKERGIEETEKLKNRRGNKEIFFDCSRIFERLIFKFSIH